MFALMRAHAVLACLLAASCVHGATQAANLGNIKSIAAGGADAAFPGPTAHTCAVSNGGTVWCWGANFFFQLGDGTQVDRSSPVQAMGLPAAAAAMPASDFGGLARTCVLTAAGGVKCWGYNFYYGVGDGTNTTRSSPVDVVGLTSGVAAVANGIGSACALTTAGAVSCWGTLAPPSSSTATPVPGLQAGVASISKNAHTCVVMTSGGVKCWGPSNDSGQLGVPIGQAFYPPVDVPGLSTGVTAVAVGGRHSCALANGGVKCWGANVLGQLGNGTTAASSPPVDVVLATQATAIALGFSHSCAITAAGGVKCWGSNSHGQLGDGTTTDRATPVDVVGLASGVTALAGGSTHTCAVLAMGEVRCWGSNFAGELGDGTKTQRLTPVAVVGALPPTPTTPALAPASDTGSSDSDRITKESRPTLQGSCDTGQSIIVSIDGAAAAPTPCTNGTYQMTPGAPLADGTHQAQAIGRAVEGDSAPTATLSFQVDTAAPAVSLTCSPTAVSSSAVQFCFNATDPGSGVYRVECSMDAEAFAACASPVARAPMAAGSHTFRVRALDHAGNTSADTTITWNVSADSEPDAFAFPAVNDVMPGAVITSAAVTIRGINTAAPVTVANGTYSVECTGTFTGAAGPITDGQTICVRHTAGAPQVPTTTTLTVGGISANFTSTSTDIVANPASLDFGGVVIMQTSAPRPVVFTNQTASTLAIQSVTVPAPYAVTHNCASLAAGASCTAQVTLSPVTEGSLPAMLTATTAAGGKTVALAGIGEKSLVTHYYRSILRREPDGPGKAYWQGEADRARTLLLDPKEVWFAMAASFFRSPEYTQFNRDAAGFVTDLYVTFFNRVPEPAGLTFWSEQLVNGMPREILLTHFVFSPEFAAFTEAIFGSTPARAEVNLVADLYRGYLARLPDNTGFGHWLGRFRIAQCAGSAAINAEVETLSKAFSQSAEYTGRFRSNSQYVGDLYNAFLRRGGDLAGVQAWISSLTSGKTREELRTSFVASLEFQARVQATIAQGCFTP